MCMMCGLKNGIACRNYEEELKNVAEEIRDISEIETQLEFNLDRRLGTSDIHGFSESANCGRTIHNEEKLKW